MTITFPAMREIVRAVLCATDRLDTQARFLLMVIAEHYNHGTGMCRLSLDLLSEETDMGKTTIRDRLTKLVESGCLEMTRQHHRACYDFTPKRPPWADERPPRERPATENRSPDGPKQEKDSSLTTEQNRVTGATMRQAMRTLPPDVAMLVKKLQQVPGKPGCAMDRLMPKVLKAVERCGQAAVEDLYALVSPEKGKMPPWRLYQMLDTLENRSDKQAPAEPEPPLPPDTPAIVEAKGLIGAAHLNIRAMADIEARMRRADVDFMPFWWKEDRHRLAQALARTITVEKGSTT